ncbi:MAG: endonuclease/exonuclease/phosphatase family protein [bacterium]
MKKVLQSKLRIAHYNILNGGEERLDRIQEVIKEIDPDICGILEAVDWQKEKNYFKNFAQKIGYQSYKLVEANSKYNIAIFSKVPILIKKLTQDFRHVAVQVILKEGKYKGLCVFFVHLSPISEEARLKELKKLLIYVKKHPEVIVMGDFNALSLKDPYNHKKLLHSFKEKNIVKYGVDQLRFDVVKKIESFGLFDSMNYLKIPFTFSVPTLSNRDINHAVALRVDYAFVTNGLLKHLKSAKIFKDKTSDIASDHYSFYIDLK